MELLFRTVAMLFGSAAVAVGVDAFLAPYKLIDGGMVGIGLLLSYHFGVLPGLSTMAVSAPIFLAVFFYDRQLFYSSFHGLVVSSFLIDLFSPIEQWFRFGMPAHAMIGGWLIGTGVGTMLAYRTNTGGTDMLAQMVTGKIGLPSALIIFAIDFAVLLAGYPIIGWVRTLFSFVTIVTVALATHRYAARKPFGRSIHYFPFEEGRKT